MDPVVKFAPVKAVIEVAHSDSRPAFNWRNVKFSIRTLLSATAAICLAVAWFMSYEPKPPVELLTVTYRFEPSNLTHKTLVKATAVFRCQEQILSEIEIEVLDPYGELRSKTLPIDFNSSESGINSKTFSAMIHENRGTHFARIKLQDSMGKCLGASDFVEMKCLDYKPGIGASGQNGSK